MEFKPKWQYNVNIIYYLFIVNYCWKYFQAKRYFLQIIVRMGSSEIMRYVALMLMQSCRLFFNSWAGQEVTDHSVEVSIAA